MTPQINFSERLRELRAERDTTEDAAEYEAASFQFSDLPEAPDYDDDEGDDAWIQCAASDCDAEGPRDDAHWYNGVPYCSASCAAPMRNDERDAEGWLHCDAPDCEDVMFDDDAFYYHGRAYCSPECAPMRCRSCGRYPCSCGADECS